MVRVKRDRRPGLASMKLTHLIGVASRDDREIVAVVLHELHQRVDRLTAEVVLAATGQRVRLVDEQNSANGLFDNLAWS